jgi:hypothetical protein
MNPGKDQYEGRLKEGRNPKIVTDLTLVKVKKKNK